MGGILRYAQSVRAVGYQASYLMGQLTGRRDIPVEPSTSESQRYTELSRHFIEKADEYLAAGDRVQASEKGWGAVTEAFKSIAEERGWHHQGHRLLSDVAYQLTEEWDRDDVLSMFDSVEKLHINFY